MKTVKDILKVKGHEIWSIAPDASMYDALKQMAEKDVGALVVLDRDHVVGIISERDYTRNVEIKGRTAKDTPVKDVMTERVMYVRPTTALDVCMALMTTKRVRHLPVIENDELVGLLSIGDIGKSIISEQEYMIEQLEYYITGDKTPADDEFIGLRTVIRLSKPGG